MSLSEWADLATILASTAIIGVAAQFFHSRKELEADHERSRREKTVDILLEWDQRLKKEGALARKIVETFSAEQCREIHAQLPITVNAKLEPLLVQLFDTTFSPTNNQITLNEAYSSELRWHVITYLNALESVLVAWQYSVVDRGIIEHQFSYLFKPLAISHVN